MVPSQSQSEIDDRATSALSTSSHTHVDFNDAHAQSPRSKMTAGSVKQIEAPEPAAQIQVEHQQLETGDTPPMLDTAQVGRPLVNRQKPTDRPPPPECMQSCLESIESCTQNVARFNERMEQSRAQADVQRRENGDPLVAKKAMIPMVFVILSWVFLAYVWRLCSRLIQQNRQGAVLGSRAEGIGLLVGFVALWLMTMWSYVAVISRGPGLVKDYVAESDPPPAAGSAEHWTSAPAYPKQSPQHQASPTAAMPIPERSLPGSEIPSTNIAVDPSTSLPYPSFNADLERFGSNRGSSDSMRVLPGSVEPKFSHSCDPSRCTVVEENTAVEGDISAADVEAQLGAERPSPTENLGATDAAADPQIPGLIGSLAAAAVAEGRGAREGAEALDQIGDQAPEHAASKASPLNANQAGATNASGWAAPERRPQNDPPPLSVAALYCHRCRRVKPPRAHHCRRCGTCVLKMDHHCPWVGGCVGAHNQRFFFIFVLWVTLLELYTLVTTAVFFHRGVRSLHQPVRSAWRVDGFLVSLFPICAVFLTFTGALLGTHVYLMAHNMTTIEHVSVARMQGKERVLIDRWVGMQKQGALGGLKQRRQMLRAWDGEWGKLTREGNRWWLGGGEQEWLGGQEKQTQTAKARHGAARTNLEQALGKSVLLWIVPVGSHPSDGLEFPMNPRFGPEGVWRKRSQWPPSMR